GVDHLQPGVALPGRQLAGADLRRADLAAGREGERRDGRVVAPGRVVGRLLDLTDRRDGRAGAAEGADVVDEDGPAAVLHVDAAVVGRGRGRQLLGVDRRAEAHAWGELFGIHEGGPFTFGGSRVGGRGGCYAKPRPVCKTGLRSRPGLRIASAPATQPLVE